MVVIDPYNLNKGTNSLSNHGMTPTGKSESIAASRDSLASGISARSMDSTGSLSVYRKSSRVFRQSANTMAKQRLILSSAQEKAKKEKMNQALTANKLRFSALGLQGRETEVARLQECFNDSTSTRQLILIKGTSGTGKSALALSLQKPTMAKGGAWISGKFNLYLRDQPFAGIVAACQELVEIIMEREPTVADQLKSKIDQELKGEIHLLTQLIPGIEKVIGRQRRSVMVNTTVDSEAKQRFHYVFCKFVQVVQSLLKPPLVLFLDDLQWADMASLELLQVLITDDFNTCHNNLMIIGCFRSNEVDDRHFLSQMLRQVRTSETSLNLTEIQLGNLNLQDTQQMLSVLLGIDDLSRIESLATICFKRTHGNVFFLRAFLVMLQEEGLLEFKFHSFQWSWDLVTIEKRTAVTANVVDLLKEKMDKSFSPEETRLLQLSSCLGTTFDEYLIKTVWKTCSEEDICMEGATHNVTTTTPDDSARLMVVDRMLQKSVNELLLEKEGATSHRWVHDKVQEAAMSLIAPNKLASTKFQVGDSLLSCFSEEEVDEHLFVLANLLNAASGNNSCAKAATRDKRMEIAKLNLKAAERAKEYSAFETAATYARKGIELLPPDEKWTADYCKVTLDLYSIAAESEACVGNTEQALSYCNEVLGRRKKTLSVVDQLRVYHVKIDTLGNGGRPKKALKLLLQVLRKLGWKFPRTPVAQGFQAIRAILRLKSYASTTISNLQLCSDPIQLECHRLLDKAGMYAYYAKDDLLFLLASVHLLESSIKTGITETSAKAVLGCAIVSQTMGDFKTGAQFAALALAIMGEFQTNRTTFIAYGMVKPWTEPLHASGKYLRAGYEMGMRIGDTESATWCILFAILLSFMSGTALATIEEDCRIYVPQMQALKREEAADGLLVLWQTVLNLMGLSANNVVLTGDVMNQSDFLERATNTESSLSFNSLQLYQGYLCAFFGDHERGAELAISKGDRYLKEMPASPAGMIDVFARGISLYAMAQETNQRKFRRRCVRVKRTLNSWTKKENPNVTHQSALLDAEHAALMGDQKAACARYKESIFLAARRGFVQDAALANERFARFLFALQEKEEATFRLQESLRLYKEWGAAGKVAMLEKEYATILEDELE